MPGVTADYSHGGPEWDARLRDAVTRLGKGYILADGLADKRSAIAVGHANVLKNGELADDRLRHHRPALAIQNEQNQRSDDPEHSKG